MNILKDKKYQRIIFGISAIVLSVIAVLGAVITSEERASDSYIYIESEGTPLVGGVGTLVEKTDSDINVIPDKYNTGCKGELIKVKADDKYEGIKFFLSSGKLAMDLCYKSPKVSGNVVLENLDFSDYNLAMINDDQVKREVNVTFVNCKFRGVASSYKTTLVKYNYNNCSFRNFSGSSSEFNRCRFGDSYVDGINPYQDVVLNDCYICNLASNDPAGAGAHSDGVQIYGHSKSLAKNIRFNRCRFEAPTVQMSGKAGMVNACIMVALEYNSAEDIYFNDCYVNGGGYTIYAGANSPYTFTNVQFNNIHVGAARLFGITYPKIAPGAIFNNVDYQDSLYVSSVWQDESGTHIITTNDTGVDRKLKIVTDLGEYEEIIEACPGGSLLKNGNKDKPFDEFPFDRDIVVSKNVNFIVCYDATDSDEKLLRSTSFDGKSIYIVDKESAALVSRSPDMFVFGSKNAESEPLLHGADASTQNEINQEAMESEELVQEVQPKTIEGVCGSSVRYSLSESGNLSITGSGAMYDFHSKKRPGWYDYRDRIYSISIDEGITVIGGYAFSNLKYINEVSFPQSVTSIRGNAFANCSSLKNIELNNSISEIGQYAFSGTSVERVIFHGTNEEWQNVKVAAYNDKLSTCELVADVAETEAEPELESEEETDDSDSLIISGSCGAGISYELNQNGCLYIFGDGEMYDYNSAKRPAWYDYADSISSIELGEGITKIGALSFGGLSKVTSITLPDSVVEISTNAFSGCGSLSFISIGKNVSLIGPYAFNGAGLNSAEFRGSEEEWNEVSVNDHNDALINTIVFLE